MYENIPFLTSSISHRDQESSFQLTKSKYAHGSGKFGFIFADAIIGDLTDSPIQSNSTWGWSTAWKLIFFISRTPQNKHYKQRNNLLLLYYSNFKQLCIAVVKYRKLLLLQNQSLVSLLSFLRDKEVKPLFQSKTIQILFGR